MNSELRRRFGSGNASNALVIAMLWAIVSVHSACWTGDDIANGDDDDTTVEDDATDDDDATEDDDDDTVGDDDTAEDADGDGWTAGEGDCDDLDPYVHPEAAELCDGADGDCDNVVDDGCVSCSSWVPDDFATIQQAIQGSPALAVICVRPGVYVERLDYEGNDVHILGVAGAAATVIDGGGAGTVVSFTNGEGPDAILEGITITGGSDPYWGESLVGGIDIQFSSPTVRNTVVSGNDGGGIRIGEGAPLLRSVLVSDNTNRSSGGGIQLSLDDSVLEDLVVRGNTSDGAGGGIETYLSDSTWQGVLIQGNHATVGGGVAAQSSRLNLFNVRIRENESAAEGGGVAFDDATSAFTNVSIEGNEAAEDGGGLWFYDYWDGCEVSLDNVVVAGNRSGGRGGGVYTYSCDIDAAQLVLAGNEATEGGAWYLSGVTDVYNSVVVGNTSTDGGGAVEVNSAPEPVFGHCDLWGNTPLDIAGMDSPVGVDGNVSVDPGFLDASAPDPLDWDLHLAANSPLVDAGDPGLADPDGGPSDLGAYGGPQGGAWDLDRDGYPAWWLPGPYDPSTSPGLDCDDRDPTIYPGYGC